jgi:hypothetical protein
MSSDVIVGYAVQRGEGRIAIYVNLIKMGATNPAGEPEALAEGERRGVRQGWLALGSRRGLRKGRDGKYFRKQSAGWRICPRCVPLIGVWVGTKKWDKTDV